MSRFVARLRRLLPFFSILALAGLITGIGAGPAAAQEWRVNKAKSNILLQLSVDGQPVEGRFSYYKAEILFDPEEPEDAKISTIIDVSSLRTGAPGFDAMLTGPEWLNAGRSQAIRLNSVSIKEKDSPDYRMEADLTIRGVTKRVSVPLKLEDHGADSKIQAQIRFNPRAFGINPGGGASEEMQITLDLAATHLTN
jgi:polyisoprenoid-binding protein YceI